MVITIMLPSCEERSARIDEYIDQSKDYVDDVACGEGHVFRGPWFLERVCTEFHRLSEPEYMTCTNVKVVVVWRSIE